MSVLRLHPSQGSSVSRVVMIAPSGVLHVVLCALALHSCLVFIARMNSAHGWTTKLSAHTCDCPAG
jgi:hypothetical protein